jgi:hypothetical protein
MSVDEFKDYVSQKCGVSITLRTVDAETGHVYGFVERYDDGKSAIINIVKNIPDRFKPAVATKELCQILFDVREDWQTNAGDTLARLVIPNTEPDAPENIAVRSENLAEQLSWELLYPIELRRADLEKIAEKTLTIAGVAARVRLPVQIVSLLLSAPYMEWCGKWWTVTVDAINRESKAAE